MFMDDYFHKDDDEVCIKLDDSYSVFKDWYSLEFNDKAPPRREFKSYVERKLNQTYGRGNKSGWYGWRLLHPDSNESGGPEMNENHLREKPVSVPKTPVRVSLKN